MNLILVEQILVHDSIQSQSQEIRNSSVLSKDQGFQHRIVHSYDVLGGNTLNDIVDLIENEATVSVEDLAIANDFGPHLLRSPRR